MRVVHISPTSEGAPWMVATLCEQKRLGHDVIAVMPSTSGRTGRALAAAGVPCIAAPTDLLREPTLWRRAALVGGLVKLLRKLRPDVVHSHIINSLLPVRLASWIADVPRHFGGNVGPLSLEAPLLRPLEAGTAFCDTRWIASCRYTRELMIAGGARPETTELIYYAVDQSKHDPALADGAHVRREFGIAPTVPVIGIVAYFYPPLTGPLLPPGVTARNVKGHDVLLRSAPRVLEAFPDAKFLLVGTAWDDGGAKLEQEAHQLARDLGIESSVIFTGERHDVPDVLAAFDVSTHCSWTDNLGGTVESLLMERPMVVSDIGGFRDTVIHEETGLRFPPGDHDALADAIIRLLRDRELAQRLGRNGRALMRERFTLARHVADLEDMYARTAPPPKARHYRLRISAIRSVIAAKRVVPLLVTAQRMLAGPFHKRVIRKMKRMLRGAVKPEKPRREPALRIAQVAAAPHNCEWLVDLCRDLAARGHDVVAIIDSGPGDLGTRLEAAGIRHYALPMTFAARFDRLRLPVYIGRIPFTALRMARILRRERIDVVHSHIFPSVVIARLATALTRGVRHVAAIPGPRHLEAPLTRRVDKLTWWLDDVTLAGCQYTRRLYLDAGAYDGRVDVIYYGINPDRFDPARADGPSARAKLGISTSAPLVSLVAHFYAPTSGVQTPTHTRGIGMKGHEFFLEAARIIAPRHPGARFVLAGIGIFETGETYRKQLIDACARDAVLRDRVVFTGFFDDVPSLLAASDVAVQASLTENLGGTIEALLMERPVVATRAGGMPEAVRHEETGLLVPPADANALAAAVLRLLENREEALAFGRAGRRLMLERFTFARMVSDVEATYARLAPQVAINDPAVSRAGA